MIADGVISVKSCRYLNILYLLRWSPLFAQNENEAGVNSDGQKNIADYLA